VGSRYGLAIRSANAGDADGIAELMRSAGVSIDSRGLASRLRAIADQSGAVLLALEWGPPSGVIALNWAWELAAEAKIASVTMLLVDPEQRRKGVARLLLKAAAQIARSSDCHDLRLTAPIQAEHLQAFCLATGFTELGPSLVRPLRRRA